MVDRDSPISLLDTNFTRLDVANNLKEDSERAVEDNTAKRIFAGMQKVESQVLNYDHTLSKIEGEDKEATRIIKALTDLRDFTIEHPEIFENGVPLTQEDFIDHLNNLLTGFEYRQQNSLRGVNAQAQDLREFWYAQDDAVSAIGETHFANQPDVADRWAQLQEEKAEIVRLQGEDIEPNLEIWNNRIIQRLNQGFGHLSMTACNQHYLDIMKGRSELEKLRQLAQLQGNEDLLNLNQERLVLLEKNLVERVTGKLLSTTSKIKEHLGSIDSGRPMPDESATNKKKVEYYMSEMLSKIGWEGEIDDLPDSASVAAELTAVTQQLEKVYEQQVEESGKHPFIRMIGRALQGKRKDEEEINLRRSKGILSGITDEVRETLQQAKGFLKVVQD